MWFLAGTNNVDAQGADPVQGGTNPYQAQSAFIDQLTDLKDAFSKFVFPLDANSLKTFVQEINKMAIAQESLTKSIERSMGGVAHMIDTSGEFASNIKNAYYGSGGQGGLIELGMTFKETSELVSALADGMGRMTMVSEYVITTMGEISKGTGMAAKDVGGLVAQMDLYNFNQKDAVDKIHELSETARKSGLSAKGYITEIQKNMKNISGFGFKSGVDGLAKMVKQAQQLRTSMEAIGAMKVQDTSLDPEGAIELAANFQMLGGAVGKLADPFQLMYMAQNDVAGLQEELVKSTKAAMTFNKETGGFDIATEDMYRLRQQAKLTGANLEDLVNTGRQAAKMDYLKDKFDMSGLSEESQDVISGLAQIEPGGRVTVDLPGYEEGNRTLEELLRDGTFTDKLEEYQKMAGKSERDIAIENMTISEEQARDVNVIKEAILRNMDPAERKSLEKSIEDLTKEQGGFTKYMADESAKVTKKAPEVVTRKELDLTRAANQTKPPEGAISNSTAADTFKLVLQDIENMTLPSLSGFPMNDAFFPANGAPMLLSKGQLYKGLADDQVAVGTNLDKILNGSGMSGKIDINLNIGGSINGDSGAIAQMFQRPEVQKQIMDTVLYKLEAYKKTKGVLA